MKEGWGDSFANHRGNPFCYQSAFPALNMEVRQSKCRLVAVGADLVKQGHFGSLSFHEKHYSTPVRRISRCTLVHVACTAALELANNPTASNGDQSLKRTSQCTFSKGSGVLMLYRTRARLEPFDVYSCCSYVVDNHDLKDGF
jgi:hypothetical protein